MQPTRTLRSPVDVPGTVVPKLYRIVSRAGASNGTLNAPCAKWRPCPKRPDHFPVISGAACASAGYPGCLAASRERSSRQACWPVIALRSSVAQRQYITTIKRQAA